MILPKLSLSSDVYEFRNCSTVILEGILRPLTSSNRTFREEEEARFEDDDEPSPRDGVAMEDEPTTGVDASSNAEPERTEVAGNAGRPVVVDEPNTAFGFAAARFSFLRSGKKSRSTMCSKTEVYESSSRTLGGARFLLCGTAKT